MDQEGLLQELRTDTARTRWTKLSIVVGDATGWASDGNMDWLIVTDALAALEAVTSLSLQFELVSIKPSLSDKWWSQLVSKLPHRITEFSLMGMPADMPLLLKTLSESLAVGSLTSFQLTCDQSRLLRLEAMPGLSLAYCAQIALFLELLPRLETLVLDGLMLVDPEPSLMAMGEAAARLSGLVHVNITPCWAHGPPPMARGLRISNPAGTLVPYEIPHTARTLFFHWSKVNCIKEWLQWNDDPGCWSDIPGCRNKAILKATEMIDTQHDFDVYHYFITQLDATAYLPS